MLAIEVRWSSGRFHATPWGRHVNEGAVEWPPAPWRLFRALVASWKTHFRHLPEEAVQRLLSTLSAEPPLFVLPPSRMGHTRHYVPSGDTQRLMIDAFVVLDPGDPLVFQWPGLHLEGSSQRLLDQLLEGLAYFGRSESWATLRRSDCRRKANCGLLEEGMSSYATLLCPEAGVTVAQLLESTASLRKNRMTRPPGSRWLHYRLPAPDARPEPVWRPRLVTFLLLDPVPQEQTLSLADQARRALLSLGQPSATLLGRQPDGSPREDGHRHLHILSEPGPSGRIEQLHLWAPEGFRHSDLALISRLRWLDRGRGRVRLLLLATSTTPNLGTSRIWRSATPFLCGRHLKAEPEALVAEVKRECHLRGLPEPRVEIVSDDGRRYGLRRGQSRPPGPPTWFRLTFPQPVDGPLALGAHSHFGMGRFLPEG